MEAPIGLTSKPIGAVRPERGAGSFAISLTLAADSLTWDRPTNRQKNAPVWGYTGALRHVVEVMSDKWNVTFLVHPCVPWSSILNPRHSAFLALQLPARRSCSFKDQTVG
ncbi:MAG: hypothetical protein ACPGUC_05870 [Gammaproteobacteria bacterium]